MGISRVLPLFCVAFCMALPVLMGGEARAQSDALFAPLAENRLTDATPQQADLLRTLQATPATGSFELVRINLGALQNDAITLVLPDAGPAVATRRKAQVHSASDIGWVGDLPAPGGPVVLFAKNGDVTGTIQSAQTIYTVTPLGGGIHALVTVDLTKSLKAPPRPVAEKAAAAPEGAAGLIVHIDPQTGAILREPAPGSVPLELSPRLQDAFSTSHQGLVEVPSPVPGGGVKVDLHGRFQSPLIVTIDANGKVKTQHLGETPASSDKK